jgi:Flp pilus assembly protein TadG
MRFSRNSILGKLLGDQRGQTLPFTAVILTSLMGLSGMAVDAGHGYYAYERLKVATNAATLAGAAGMPNTDTAQSNVNTYSSAATQDKNYLGSLVSSVVTTTTFSCSSTVSSKLGVTCETSSGGTGGYNALTVKQTATVKTWFGSLFGIPQFNIAASSMAAMKGGSNQPWNIAIILDTTASMGDRDSGAQCSGTQIQCAIEGVQQLLENLQPCPTSLTCSSTSKYVDDVALYVFPPVLSTTAKYDYCSGGTTPTHEYYEVPALSTSPVWTYQIINYSHDFKTVGGAGSTLATGSSIVKALGYTGGGCSGIQAPGGAGTYYAQVIAQAQADLLVQQTNNPGSQSAMIILTDGNATSSTNYTVSRGVATFSSTSQLQPSTTNSMNGISTNNPNSFTYPSAVGECGQAVYESQLATKAGTDVYTIGYGALTSGSSSNCASDLTYSFTGSTTYGGGPWGPHDSPCQALAAMASDAAHFYSDDADGCAATTNLDYTTFKSIFTKISSDLTAARLIPLGTT